MSSLEALPLSMVEQVKRVKNVPEIASRVKRHAQQEDARNEFYIGMCAGALYFFGTCVRSRAPLPGVEGFLGARNVKDLH